MSSYRYEGPSNVSGNTPRSFETTKLDPLRQPCLTKRHTYFSKTYTYPETFPGKYVRLYLECLPMYLECFPMYYILKYIGNI